MTAGIAWHHISPTLAKSLSLLYSYFAQSSLT